ncbi:hypothetical protein [Pontiella desulfatans]|uniref:hypothetical protein n=1 Tax=Pontiella desulfatans TaxID=2750659 RepID=UPI00109CB00B|nr:hypothetical protein [Pontiella desulfatans]
MDYAIAGRWRNQGLLFLFGGVFQRVSERSIEFHGFIAAQNPLDSKRLGLYNRALFMDGQFGQSPLFLHSTGGEQKNIYSPDRKNK